MTNPVIERDNILVMSDLEIFSHLHQVGRFFARNHLLLTEAHAAQALEQCERDYESDVSSAFHFEDYDHKYQYESGLATHNDELRNDVREEHFEGRHTWKK